MKKIKIFILLILALGSCQSSNEIKLYKDIIFGLELGMTKDTVEKILSEKLRKKEVVQFPSHISMTRKKDDLEITFDLFKPKYENDSLSSYIYVIQPLSEDGNFSDKFHKIILDDLRYTYGDAKSVTFPEKDKTELIWILNKECKIELIINKKEDIYSLTYMKLKK